MKSHNKLVISDGRGVDPNQSQEILNQFEINLFMYYYYYYYHYYYYYYYYFISTSSLLLALLLLSNFLLVLFVYEFMSICIALISQYQFIHNINILKLPLQSTELKLPSFNIKASRAYLENYCGL